MFCHHWYKPKCLPVCFGLESSKQLYLYDITQCILGSEHKLWYASLDAHLSTAEVLVVKYTPKYLLYKINIRVTHHDILSVSRQK